MSGQHPLRAGNIDKRALIKGKEAIDKEVEKVRALLDMGRYFPDIGHDNVADVNLR